MSRTIISVLALLVLLLLTSLLTPLARADTPQPAATTSAIALQDEPVE